MTRRLLVDLVLIARLMFSPSISGEICSYFQVGSSRHLGGKQGRIPRSPRATELFQSWPSPSHPRKSDRLCITLSPGKDIDLTGPTRTLRVGHTNCRCSEATKADLGDPAGRARDPYRSLPVTRPQISQPTSWHPPLRDARTNLSALKDFWLDCNDHGVSGDDRNKDSRCILPHTSDRDVSPNKTQVSGRHVPNFGSLIRSTLWCQRILRVQITRAHRPQGKKFP
jgi:hypothetical protein